MTASRLQHIVSSGIVLFVAVIVTWISFTQQPADAFLFPRLIAIFFIGLAVWNFIRAISGMAKVGEGLDSTSFINIVPGLVVMAVYVFFAAKSLGFYFASTIAFLTVFTIYDSVPLRDIRGWIKRILVTAIFMLVIYGLFAMLLKVQTPRGIWF
ncbi:MAG: tripartite tricarboxylate transporter TctB family protein [Rhizobiaceae bacterium]|nr:tripartite tricarboxylate transporter TctB family protein [Rhizobiaceae bacterium]